MFAPGFKGTKLKTNLRLAVNRLKLLEKKKTEIAQKARREIADYIQQGKDDRARIRVEHIIREDYYVEAMELVEMYCDLLLARFGLIETMKTVDPNLQEVISSLIWVSPRMCMDVVELKVVAEQLKVKYGKEFFQMALSNENGVVNEKLIMRMGVEPPAKILVERYLIEIARSHKVSYEPDQSVLNPDEETEDLIGFSSEFSAGPDDIGANSKPPGGPPAGPPGGPPGPPGGPPGFPPNFGGGSGGGNAYAQKGPVQHDPSLVFPPSPMQQQPMAANASPKGGPPPLPNRPPAGFEHIRGPPPHMSTMPSAPQQSPPHPYPGQAPPRYSAIDNNPIYPPQNQMPTPPPGATAGPPPGAVGGAAGPYPPKSSPADSIPDLPSVPTNNLPAVNGNSNLTKDDQDELDFDDLSKRFEELKKKK